MRAESHLRRNLVVSQLVMAEDAFAVAKMNPEGVREELCDAGGDQ